MSGGRWVGLVAAAMAAFVLGAVLVFGFMLSVGQSLLGWHDNIGPEVFWGLVGGFVAAVITALALYARWTGKPGERRA